MHHAEDLFANVGANVGTGRQAPTGGAGIVAIDASKPNETINLAALPLFNPITKAQFETLRNTLVPILCSSSEKGYYGIFLQEMYKQLARDLPSEQIKKIASGLTALSNEKLKEEKAGDKSNKKSKAQKTKTALVTTRGNQQDLQTYDDDDGFGE